MADIYINVEPQDTTVQVVEADDVSAFLKGPALTAGREVLQGWIDGRGLPPQAARLAAQAMKQLDKVIGKQVDRLFLPG